MAAVESLQQRTPAWHAARRGKLTASNLGSALGLCPWTSRQQAYNRALGLERFVGAQFKLILGIEREYCFCTGMCNDACVRCLKQSQALRKWRARITGVGNDATRYGTQNEPNGILAYSAHTGNVVQNTGLHVHPHTSWLAGSPDGLIGTEGMLEVKCPYWMKKNGSRLHKEIPAHYYLQVNLCLECGQREWCDFISWSPEGYKIYRVTRDTELHERLMPYYLNFFAAMQRMAKSPPVLTAEEKAEIEQVVAESMKAHINYDFWARADLEQSPPETEEEEEPEEPPAKRVKTEVEE